jgi:RNA polymerase sigma-70 factor (ECF subfamily)
MIPETDLITGCIQGDRKMQYEMYQRFAPKMYGVCLRYAANAEEAEDMLQEGFVKVFRKLDSFRREGSFEGWVRRIFVNTAIEQFRKKNYLQPITEREEATVEGSYLSVLDNLAERDIIGLVQQLSTLFLPNQLQNTAIFVVFLIIVLLRPQGLFGAALRRT